MPEINRSLLDHVRRPISVSQLVPDEIERCVRTIDLALRSRGCRDEAVAAIDRLFGAEPPPPPTLESSVHDIGLSLRTASLLDDQGIETAADLRRILKTGRIWSLSQIGQLAVRQCVWAIHLIEGHVRDYQI
jgi:hypothetical protein